MTTIDVPAQAKSEYNGMPAVGASHKVRAKEIRIALSETRKGPHNNTSIR